MTIANRIIRFGTQRADQVLANPANPRVHPQFQRDVMREALNTLGWLAPVIVNQDGYLIDGHERVMQALVNNDEVPFVEVDLDDEEAALALATFDPVGDLARYDVAALGKLLESVQTDAPVLQQMLNNLSSLAISSTAKDDGHFDSTQLPDSAGQGATKLTYLLYISFPSQEQFKRALKTLTGGKRDTNADHNFAQIDGTEYLDLWETLDET